MKKIIISISLIIIWMIVIYSFSSMPSEESNGKSKEVIKQVVEKTLNSNQKFKEEIDISEQNISLDNIKQQTKSKTETIVDKLNKPLRKCMHASVYFILAILIFNFLKIYNLKNWKNALFTIIISFLYACTDEYHQTFVKGRTGQFTDTLIDTLGAITGVVCICIIIKIIKKMKNNTKSE